MADQRNQARTLAVGDELVRGAAVDTNSAHIAKQLEAAGWAVRGMAVVSDEPDALTAAIRAACADSRLVIATGGLGPTADDRTRAAAAAAAGVGLAFDDASWERIQEMFSSRGLTPPPSNRAQAELPEGAVVLRNDWGTAPGFALGVADALFVALPGVPAEMRPMLTERALPLVREQLGQAEHYAARQLTVMGLPEAALGERLVDLMAPAANPRLGVTAHLGLHTVRIVGRDATADRAAARSEAVVREVRARLGEMVLYEGEAPLEQRVVEHLRQRGLRLALAESCTGGLIAARLVSVPGASAAVRGGVVAYADDVKEELLGVPASTLAEHGAVSTAVGAAMARGAAERLGADIGVGITGIAGPDGGTADKPVGTVCFGYYANGAAEGWEQRFPQLGRAFVQNRSMLEVLVTLLRRS
ncbi:MAG: CinA family nicotinamide mononucleotide deamidase-related protein [Planctomycetota bacterium]